MAENAPSRRFTAAVDLAKTQPNHPHDQRPGALGTSLWHRPVNHFPIRKGGKGGLLCASVRRTLTLMAGKTKRWTLRVTPAQDTIVR